MRSTFAPHVAIEPIACHKCRLGQLSGLGQGQFCPFVMRKYEPGDIVCLAGNAADHVWYVKSGIVGLTRARDMDRNGHVEAICLPASFIGLECLVGDRFLRTARAISRAILCCATREGFQRWADQSDERAEAIEGALLADPLLSIDR
jgi:CRP-like cAMP-binding protein